MVNPAHEPRPVLDPGAVYLGDNGRAFCGRIPCAGLTAVLTGRDLSGQRVQRVTPEDVEEAGFEISCENCGRT